jgi:NADH:ubiquinone oxidoreductase subunit H
LFVIIFLRSSYPRFRFDFLISLFWIFLLFFIVFYLIFISSTIKIYFNFEY